MNESNRMMGATAIKEPDAPLPARSALIAVPRAHVAKYQAMPWAELVAAAERGDDGLYVTNSTNFGVSYYREGDKGGLLNGKPSLFCQGWVKVA